MEATLDDNGLLEYIKTDVTKPQASDAQNLDQWKKDVAKVRRIILEGLWDHIDSNIHEKKKKLHSQYGKHSQIFSRIVLTTGI